MTVPEHAARGKAARSHVPRQAHAEIDFADDRDPVAVLEEQAATRIPELVPIRYGRMLVSPFAFYRGAAAIMAMDLARTPSTGLRAQLCGDAHLSNFGVFASPERALIFDINDFDETIPGPWEWDVKRLAASMAVAGRGNDFSRTQRRAVVRATVGAYREAMAEFAAMPTLALWYVRLDIDRALREYNHGLDQAAVRRTQKDLAKARTRDSTRAFAKLTRLVDGQARIRSDPPLIVPLKELVGEQADQRQIEHGIEEILTSYSETLQSDRRHLLRHFRMVDLARRVVGVGSVGTWAWVALFLGNNDEPLFLQVKEAQPSVLERYVGKSAFDNQGARVVAGQRLMQGASDIFLGWKRSRLRVAGQTDAYVRQLYDWKGSAEVDAMTPQAMTLYGRMCGWTLARAHARFRRPDGDCRLPGKVGCVRSCPGGVRGNLRRPQRARLRGAAGGGRQRSGGDAVRALIRVRCRTTARRGRHSSRQP